MSSEGQSVLCGKCRIPVKGPADPDVHDVFSCPNCGRSDTFENVMASAKAFVNELAQRSLQESMRQAVRGSKIMKFSGKTIPEKNYPFVTNHKL